jgi:hypothetical protein
MFFDRNCVGAGVGQLACLRVRLGGGSLLTDSSVGARRAQSWEYSPCLYVKVRRGRSMSPDVPLLDILRAPEDFE